MQAENAAPVRAFIGLGSNLQDPAAQVRRALVALGRLPDTELVQISALYHSKPVGPADQPDYINAVAEMSTALDARTLLASLKACESKQGRQPAAQHWGPRLIDLDLLVYGQQIIEDPDLVVPHPELADRAFVLVPLAEIAPDLLIPGYGRLDRLLAACPRDDLRRLEDAVVG